MKDDKGFEIKCKKCNSHNVQISRSAYGVFFDCVDCEQEMTRSIIDYNEDGLYEYEDSIEE